jgi:hypothetical protein
MEAAGTGSRRIESLAERRAPSPLSWTSGGRLEKLKKRSALDLEGAFS